MKRGSVHRKAMKTRIMYSAIMVMIVCLMYAGGIIGYGVLSLGRPSEACVVFGNTVHEDGTPSNRLKARLDKSIELYHQGYCKTMITSGGLGKEGYDEAAVMRTYLLKHGVPEANIVQDSAGNTTYATVQFIKQYCTDHNVASVLAVSQYFHLSRIRVALAQIGVKNVSVEAPRYAEFRDLFSIPREMVALPVYLAKHY